jgi:GGDEF domain-containing protein
MAIGPLLRRRLLAVSGLGYAIVFALFLVFERPGLGVAHLFYIPIIIAAMAEGPVTGAMAGVVATVFYAAAVTINPHIPSTDVPTLATAIRMVSFVAVGGMIGYYASMNRKLMGGAYDLVEELSILARRDVVTGLPNTRGFESVISKRLESPRPFALLVGDATNVAGDEGLLSVGDRLARYVESGDEVARVGETQFAVLTENTDDAGQFGARLERLLDSAGFQLTFGWATFPRDGKNALALFRAADERLYARKVVRGEWRPTAASAGLVEELGR